MFVNARYKKTLLLLLTFKEETKTLALAAARLYKFYFEVGIKIETSLKYN